MSRAMRERLAALTGQLYSAVYSLTPRQRTAAVRALDELTQTNCPWHLYRLRGALRGMIDDASTSRERDRRLRVDRLPKNRRLLEVVRAPKARPDENRGRRG